MIGDRIQALRRSKGLSQAELSRLLNVSQVAVSKWESGASRPELDMLQAMADVFGVSLDVLCEREPLNTGDAAIANIAVMNRAFRRMTPEEQEKLLAVGRMLFEHAFGKDEA